MALTRDQKSEQLQELIDKIRESKSVMFTHYIGLSVSEVNEFRRKLREGGAEMKVAKKTLMKLAAKEVGLPEITDDILQGPVSLIFSSGDPLAGAQITFKYSKDHDKVAIIGGMFEGQLLNKNQALELAKMPSRDVLLSMFVGMIRSPLVSFASICSSPLSGFARALSQIAEKGGVSGQGKEINEAEETKETDESKEKNESSLESSESVESSDSSDEPAKAIEETSPESAS